MARKKKTAQVKKHDNPNVMGLHAEVLEQPITETLEVNYMPYAMSVIISRAIPEIDGFKPSHRKLLYTMYQMKLLGGNRTKSANVVGSTMKLNPHGDAAIYDTMVRLSRGYGALLHPLVDSKGNFGRVFSRDTAYAASRYTEVRLAQICNEIFADIDKDTVDFVDNYDGTLKEPTLLPTRFPNILVSANQGIAVGMASSLCGFNLGEVCDTTIARLRHPKAELSETLLGPDFPTGGQLIYDKKAMDAVYNTGRGSFKVRGKWRYVKDGNLIEIYEIPYSTTVEAIIDKITDLVKSNTIKEISDVRDETDLSGLKLAIDLKRGADPEKLMARLSKLTPFQDSVSCNFNVLINGTPKVMGVGEILDEWTAWRMDSIRRRTSYDKTKKEKKLHLLLGLQKILVDIDKAIKIIRETEEDALVIPNLMKGFDIDQIQAEYVADIRLRNINKEYILNRTKEIEKLEDDIADLEDILADPKRVKKIIISELKDVKKKYAQPRKTEIVEDTMIDVGEEAEIPNYPVHLFISQAGYLKKITPQSLRMSGEQKYKDGDAEQVHVEASNKDELLVFTDQFQCYKTRLSDFADSKASLLGDYLPSKLGMDDGENVIWTCIPGDYSGNLFFFYENGKVARVPMEKYQTAGRRRKLTSAYSDKSPLKSIIFSSKDVDVAIYTTDNRALIFNTELLLPKSTRATQGVAVINLKKNATLNNAKLVSDSEFVDNEKRYRSKKVPGAGAIIK